MRLQGNQVEHEDELLLSIDMIYGGICEPLATVMMALLGCFSERPY